MAKLELRKKAAVDKEDYDTAKVIKADPEIVSDTLKWAVPSAAAVIILGVGLSRLGRRGSFARPESP